MFGAELIARLKLNISDFTRGLATAGDVGGKFGSTLGKKLGMGAAFKGFVADLGLGVMKIKESIAEAIAGGTKEGFAQAGQLFEQEMRLIEQRILEGMDDAAKRSYYRRQIDKAAAEEKSLSNSYGATNSELAKKLAGMGQFTAAAGALVFGPMSEEERLKKMGDARLRQREAELKLAEMDKKDREQALRGEKEFKETSQKVLDLRIANLRASLPLEIQIEEIRREIVRAEREAAGIADYTVERNKALLAVEEKKKALGDLLNKQQEERTQRTEKEARQREKIVDLYRRYLSAEQEVGEARQRYQDAFRDRYALSLGDPTRGTDRDRARMQAIAQLEERARRIFAGGGTFAADASGRRMSAEDYARSLQSRADAMRAGFSRLKSDERDPLREAARAILESEKHLKEIRANLTAEAIK